jgi:hypothetical protein
MAMTNAEKLRKWRAANKDKVKEQKTRYRERNPDAAKEYRERTKERAAETRLEWQRANSEKVNEHCKQWRDKYPEKNLAKAIRYRASKDNRTVSWDKELTDLVVQEASHKCFLMQKLTGYTWHVDHVIPLNGKRVSGLHVWNNLAVIPASQNMSKSNRYTME